MAEYYEPDAEGKKNLLDVREALILAGIAELEEHGPVGFSLRRVAMACGVSCAAPYKHFRDKDAFFDAIVSYIDEKWMLLEAHILEVFLDERECLLELCLASVRFWIGNPHFRAVRMMQREGRERTSVGNAAETLLRRLAEKAGAQKDTARILYTVRSLVVGATLMLEDGTLENTPKTFSMLREALKKEIDFE